MYSHNVYEFYVCEMQLHDFITTKNEKCLKVTAECTLNISQFKVFGHLILTAMVANQKSHF